MSVQKKIVERVRTLQRKAEKEAGVAKGEKVEQWYNGASEAYTQAIQIVKDEFQGEDETTVDYDSKMTARFWKGMALGILVGGIAFTGLVQWLMTILG